MIIVLSDLHLGHHRNHGLIADLAALVRAHPRAELIFNGDSFDLSLESPRQQLAAFAGLLDQQQGFCGALREHALSGGQLVFISGNHDPVFAHAEAREVLLAKLDLTAAAPLETEHWFVRRQLPGLGSMHIEHGNLYDPDNAPAHPLAPWSERTEPLGPGLMRRFVARTGQAYFAHQSEVTPLQALANAYRRFGLKTNVYVAQYFAAAAGFCLQALTRSPGETRAERALGAARLAGFAAGVGLPVQCLEQLLQGLPMPRHERFGELFMRLYFDRVLSCLCAASGLGLAALSGGLGAVVLGASGVSYLALSALGHGNRYGGNVVSGARDSARAVLEQAAADWVVFGHTHVPEQTAGYLNSGSFAYSPEHSRPFVRLSERAEVAFWPRSERPVAGTVTSQTVSSKTASSQPGLDQAALVLEQEPAGAEALV